MPRPLNVVSTSETDEPAAEPVRAPAEIAFAAPSPEEMRQHAAILVDNPSFIAAIQKWRDEITNRWRSSKLDESELREHLWAQNAALVGIEEMTRRLKMKGK